LETGGVDLVLTDPPYPTYKQDEYHYDERVLYILERFLCQQYIFWTPAAPFPLDWCGMHVWDKATGSHTQFELIYQRNIGTGYQVHRFITPHNRVRAQWCGDVCVDHLSQKPVQLIRVLIQENNRDGVVLDPFSGSGTTLIAARKSNRTAIGIEIEEKYCEIAAGRLALPLVPEKKKGLMF
jgi:DNA modification methylase